MAMSGSITAFVDESGVSTIVDLRSVADARAGALERINGEFASELAQGMPWEGRHLALDAGTRMNLIGAALRANLGTLPQPFGWSMIDGSLLSLTPDQLIAMASAAMDHYAALVYRHQAAHAAIAAATIIGELDAVAL